MSTRSGQKAFDQLLELGRTLLEGQADSKATDVDDGRAEARIMLQRAERFLDLGDVDATRNAIKAALECLSSP